jgi:hypothetical protein
MNILEQLEKHLKDKGTKNQIIGYTLPPIRYFDGTQSFSDVNGWYKADTLEGSIKLYLESKHE